MKKKRLLFPLCAVMIFSLLTGCNSGTNANPSQTAEQTETATISEGSPVATDDTETTEKDTAERPEVNMMLVNGFAAIGAVNMLEENENGTTRNQYNVTLATAPDEVSAKLLAGEVDIASIPTNMAATLYNKSDGEIIIIAVNTLGVVKLVTTDESIQSLSDLADREVYGCGQGAIPEYAFEYILQQNGIDTATDLTVTYKPGHEEVSSLMSSGQIAIATIPEPSATKVTEQNPDARVVLDLTAEWDKLGTGAMISQGCVVAQRSLIEENPEVIADFLAEYERSCGTVHSDLETTAALCAKFEILDEAVARKAIPEANQVFIVGQQMRDGLEPFFEILFEANSQSVGGSLPDSSFYYIP